MAGTDHKIDIRHDFARASGGAFVMRESTSYHGLSLPGLSDDARLNYLQGSDVLSDGVLGAYGIARTDELVLREEAKRKKDEEYRRAAEVSAEAVENIQAAIKRLEEDIKRGLEDLANDVKDFKNVTGDINKRLEEFIVKQTQEKEKHLKNYDRIEELRRVYATGNLTDVQRKEARDLIELYIGNADSKGDLGKALEKAQDKAQEACGKAQGKIKDAQEQITNNNEQSVELEKANEKLVQEAIDISKIGDDPARAEEKYNRLNKLEAAIKEQNEKVAKATLAAIRKETEITDQEVAFRFAEKNTQRKQNEVDDSFEATKNIPDDWYKNAESGDDNSKEFGPKKNENVSDQVTANQKISNPKADSAIIPGGPR